MPSRRLLCAVPRGHAADLAPLFAAYAARRVEVRSWLYGGDVPEEPALGAAAADCDAVLLVGRGERAPGTVLSGPVLATASGRRIPIGWVPVVDRASLARFVSTAVRLHERAHSVPSVALLAQRHPRFLRLTDRIEAILDGGERRRTVFRWTSDALVREDLIRALASGLGSAIYVGHGRPTGWTGYYGLRARHFDGFTGEPLGALIALCCRTASRRRTRLSFAEALPLKGVCGAVFGAVSATLHTDNTRWAVRLSDAYLHGARTLADLVLAALPATARQVAPYRILGDPLCPLRAPARGLRRARAVEVYA
ncbi:MAG TPA: C25 family cysteine peptidase [Candidatus Krumholzibacteria bacterium]|nr:C25 family cysteine peptidase [Candidatus Krumholzibacteria bacterium]HPD71875.1 C25 family cysteine peptidase [Candidatus Krumholzibacteria bacterium]HRY41192.1 C25 family cysteine peptidase [Candidatus Krumholzibacteria bacterium]